MEQYTKHRWLGWALVGIAVLILPHMVILQIALALYLIYRGVLLIESSKRGKKNASSNRKSTKQ